MSSRLAAIASLTCCVVALHVHLDPVGAVPKIAAGIARDPSPPSILPCNGPARTLQFHVVELAKTDRNVPANDTVGGGLVFANPVSRPYFARHVLHATCTAQHASLLTVVWLTAFGIQL
jgi:hypothetical protein